MAKEMDYAELIEQAEAKNYFDIKNMLQKGLQQAAEEAVPKAGFMPEVAVSIQSGLDELYQEMNAFQETEKELTPKPSVWRHFAEQEQQVIKETLAELGKLFDHKLQDVREGIEKNKVYQATEQAVHSLKQAANSFSKENILARQQQLDMEKDMKDIQKSVLELQELLTKEGISEEAKKHLEDCSVQISDMMERYQSLYQEGHSPSGKIIVSEMEKVLDTMQKSVKTVKDDLEVCVVLKRAAVKEDAKSAYDFIAYSANKITKRASVYVQTVDKAIKNIYKKGKSLGNKLMNLRGYFGVRDNSDTLSRYMAESISAKSMSDKSLGTILVKKMIQDGIKPDDIVKEVKGLEKDMRTAMDSRAVRKLLEKQDVATR